ncbi:MAG: TolC family protein, partial [Bacteroidales bacterium]|nr:TolC family protein [Bacteroidales bacterium]
LSDWGGQARKIQRYDYELQKTENEKDFLAEQLLLQLRKLRFDLLTAWEQMQLAREAERTAKASMEQTQAHYRAGLAALSELLQAQLALRESADRLTDQKIAYKNALQAYLSRMHRAEQTEEETLAPPLPEPTTKKAAEEKTTASKSQSKPRKSTSTASEETPRPE